MDPGLAALSASGSLLLWTNLHYLLRLLGVSADYGWLLNTKFVYTFVVLRLAYLYHAGPHSESHAEVYTNLLVLSAGFNLYHMTQVVRRSVLLHHVSTATVLCYILCTGGVDTPVGDLAAFILGGSVVTEPLIFLRRALKRVGVYSGGVKRGVGWILAVSFSVVRVAWVIRIVVYFLSPGVDLFIAGILVVIVVLSVYFSCRMLNMARELLL